MPPAPARRVLLVSTPVGPLGSGVGGGVELTIHGVARGLAARGHEVTIVAPAGSLPTAAPIRLLTALGQPQVPSQTQERTEPINLPPDPVLAAMWDVVRVHAPEADVVVNLAYDWLPFFLTPYLAVPVLHLVSMGSLNDAMDLAIERALDRAPGSVAVHSHAQAATFPFADRLRVIGNGIDVDRYHPAAKHDDALVWVGRISPEKGLTDAVEVAARTGRELRVYGLLEHEWAWKSAIEAHPEARVTYGGFLPTDRLQAAVAKGAALLVTPKWVEAFGNVAIEALACGVPVVAYARGGPAEIVRDGETGFLVEPDDVDALVAAVGRVGELDRAACRRQAEAEWSLDALADRVEAWFTHATA